MEAKDQDKAETQALWVIQLKLVILAAAQRLNKYILLQFHSKYKSIRQ
jgi:hypothetical protein